MKIRKGSLNAKTKSYVFSRYLSQDTDKIMGNSFMNKHGSKFVAFEKVLNEARTCVSAIVVLRCIEFKLPESEVIVSLLLGCTLNSTDANNGNIFRWVHVTGQRSRIHTDLFGQTGRCHRRNAFPPGLRGADNTVQQ